MSDAAKAKATKVVELSFEPLGSPRQVHSTNGLFVDASFPMDMQLLPQVEWKRPKDICCAPQFIIDGATRMDVCQGSLNDCWFLSAVASLSLNPSLLKHVVPSGQSFQQGYDGSFRFKFWQYGEWVEMKIDDRLPTQNGQLVYLSSSQTTEFWSALLEKAYAKLKGGYRALNMGFPHEAMVDMTGGVTEVFHVAALPIALGEFLKPLLDKGALIGCANSQGAVEQKNEMGIMFRHAYSITRVESVVTKYGSEQLVRIHNPWGKAEWEGAWSDMNGQEWGMVSSTEQCRVERVQQDDGEFWMSMSDFRQNFDVMEVCHLSDDTLSSNHTTKRPWHVTLHHGGWVPQQSAGGPPQGVWHWQNPQFHLTLLEEDDDPADPEMTCSFLVALMQKHHRRTGIQLAIGLDIYSAPSDRSFLSPTDFLMLRPLLSTKTYTQRREVVIRGRLAPGHYIIIPSTSVINQGGEFILRVLTEKGNKTTVAKEPGVDGNSPAEFTPPTPASLPAVPAVRPLFKKHCSKEFCRPLELFNLLTEAIGGGALAGSERKLCLEHCKSFVVLMDSQGLAQLDWSAFQTLWEKFSKWTDIFVKFDKNKSHSLEYPEISPALQAAGLQVDEFVLQLIGLRYTEPDMTVSYPGFLYLLMKLESMLRKFQAHDMVGMGTISVNRQQWLYMTMYN